MSTKFTRPDRVERLCHRQLVNYTWDADKAGDLDCMTNECSIYDNEREQCGDQTQALALAKLAGLSIGSRSATSLGISDIMNIYNEENGNKAKTAARLGLTRSTFYRRVAKLGIDEQLGIKRR